MNIVVCVKYVPDATGDRKFEDDNTVDRVGVDGLLSELDEYAVEQALQFREKREGEEITVTALTVGPEKAVDAVRKALQMGADAGVHVVDDAIAGSDYLGTSLVLAKAIVNVTAARTTIDAARLPTGSSGRARTRRSLPSGPAGSPRPSSETGASCVTTSAGANGPVGNEVRTTGSASSGSCAYARPAVDASKWEVVAATRAAPRANAHAGSSGMMTGSGIDCSRVDFSDLRSKPEPTMNNPCGLNS